MATILTASPTEIAGGFAAGSRNSPGMGSQTQEPTPPHNIKTEDDKENVLSRIRGRTEDQDGRFGEGEPDEDADGEAEDVKDPNSSNSDGGPVRKRRRSRRGLDKKFECPEKGCGKTYSRAEHLYRHQLNHTPKQIYKCDYPECTRTFVRLDLCNRHKDRHTAKGSSLNRRDTTMSMGSGVAPGSASPETNRPGSAYSKTPGAGGRPTHLPYHSPNDVNGAPYTPITSTPPTGYPNGGPPNGADGYGMHPQQHPGPHPGQHPGQQHPHEGYVGTPVQRPMHHSPSGHARPTQQQQQNMYGVLSPVSTQPSYNTQSNNTPQAAPFVPQSNLIPFSLPPQEYPPPQVVGAGGQGSAGRGPEQAQNYAQQQQPGPEYAEHAHQQQGEMLLLDNMSMPNTIPMFGSDSILSKSPYVSIPDDFVAFLFNNQNEGSPMGQMVPHSYSNYNEYQQNYNGPYFGSDPAPMGYFPPAAPPTQVMSVTSLLDANLPESVISDDKSLEIYELIRDRFLENDQAPINRQRDNVLDGNQNDDSHILSRKMMQQYIGSYWLHFSDQVPILHKPTFSPDKTPNLLLIAMMTIGAACLDKAHGQAETKAGAQLSNFLAWHLRWEIFMDPNFRPPAKLWIFQTLLLLELYEKMYSTRELHERAHIHHATTITLMRRGRSLIGKSAMDSPPNLRDEAKQAAGGSAGGAPTTNGSRHSSTSVANTPDDWWNHWITNEATRRASFTAFVIDSIHATMFGHSTVMVAHEMRLPLPCDDVLWKATSGSEVGRIESNMISQGLKPVSFLEGLKRTLSNQEVQTNSFGRTVLMSGLLSVSWHMNQRDLQVNSLGGGVSQALGGRDKWRGTLTRAFDCWKTEFDKSLQRDGSAAIMQDPYRYEPTKRNEANVVFESRTVLHHLAHMAMHVDIVDCQIFARAKRLLGRAIGTQDLNSAQRRMKDVWAPSAKARDATYYALRFLCSVLLPEEAASGGSPPASSQSGNGNNGGPAPPTSIARSGPYEPYSARDDVLLNRPWVLYFAALVVWCYGFALEGPCQNGQLPQNPAEKAGHMQDYLRRYGGVSSPEELKAIKGVNNNSALLMVLRDSFQETRWELLHEGATLLSNCIQLNVGAPV